MASPKKKGTRAVAKKAPASPAKKLAVPRKSAMKPPPSSTTFRKPGRVLRWRTHVQVMGVDVPERPHSPTGLSDLSELTTLSELEQERKIWANSTEQGILNQNTATTSNDREHSIDTAQSLAVELLDCVSQRTAENISGVGEEGTRSTTRGATPRLDQDYSYRVQDLNGTEGQVAGPSRIGIHPAGPVLNKPPRRSPNSIDVESRTMQLNREEKAIQADLNPAANHPLEPPSRRNIYPLPRHTTAVLDHTDSEIANLPSEGPQPHPMNAGPSLARHATSRPTREGAEVDAIEACKDLTFRCNNDGSMHIVGDRSTPHFQELLWVIRNSQRAGHLLRLIQEPDNAVDVPMEGIIDEDDSPTVTPVAPVFGVDTTNIPAAGPSNVQVDQVNPRYSNRGLEMQQDVCHTNLEKLPAAEGRLDEWVAVVQAFDRSDYQGSIYSSNDDNTDTDSERPVIVWCPEHNRVRPCYWCDDESMVM